MNVYKELSEKDIELIKKQELTLKIKIIRMKNYINFKHQLLII